MSRDGWNRFKLGGKWSYDVERLGYKYNMTDISAAFGLNQLPHIDQWQLRRTYLAKRYSNALSDIAGLKLPCHIYGDKHAWHLYVITLISESWKISRDQFFQILSDHGIGCSVHYKPVHMQSYYVEKYGYKSDDFKHSHMLSQRVISLPLYPALTDEEQDYIIDIIKELWLKMKC